MIKQNKAITLIALIITIIVLLVLAGVTINMVLGENGLFNKAKTSVAKYENAQERENTALADYETEIDSARDTVTISKEEYEQMKDDITTLKNKKFKIEKIGQVTGGSSSISFDPSKYDALYVKLIEGTYGQIETTTIYTFELGNGVHWVQGGPNSSVGRWAYVVINNLSSMTLGSVWSDGSNCASTTQLILYGINF